MAHSAQAAAAEQERRGLARDVRMSSTERTNQCTEGIAPPVVSCSQASAVRQMHNEGVAGLARPIPGEGLAPSAADQRYHDLAGMGRRERPGAGFGLRAWRP